MTDNLVEDTQAARGNLVEAGSPAELDMPAELRTAGACKAEQRDQSFCHPWLFLVLLEKICEIDFPVLI